MAYRVVPDDSCGARVAGFTTVVVDLCIGDGDHAFQFQFFAFAPLICPYMNTLVYILWFVRLITCIPGLGRGLGR